MKEDAQLRERVLSHAGKRFFEEGFSRITTDELSRELGISKKTLYREFRSKKEILGAVVRRKLEEVERELAEVCDDEGRGFLERLRAQLHVATRIGHTLSKPFISDLARFAPELWEEISRFRQERVFSRMERLLRAGQEEGLLRREVEPKLLVTIVVTIAENLLVPGRLTELDFVPRDVIRHVELMIAHGVLSEAGEARLVELEGGREPK